MCLATPFSSHSLPAIPPTRSNTRFTIFLVMKLHALTTLLFLSAATLGTVTRAQPQDQQHQHRSHRDMLVARAELDFAAKRQAAPVFAAAPPPTASNQASSSQAASAVPAAPLTSGSAAASAGATTTSSLSASAASGSGTGATGTGSSMSTPVPTGPNGVPPLSFISSGMPPGTPSPVVSTYAPGATPPISGAPALPAPCTFPLRPVSSRTCPAHGLGIPSRVQ